MNVKPFGRFEISSDRSATRSAPADIPSIEESRAAAYEAKVAAELTDQFRELKRQAHGIFDALKGRIGARNEEYLEQVFAKAGADYASGQFLMQRLGADRQLDLPLVATLTQLRQSLLANVSQPSAADQMLADSAIVAYRNMLRVQGWLGSLCLVIERQLFGQIPLSGADAAEVEAMLEKMESRFLPMLERCQRMLCRALDRLEAPGPSGSGAYVSIGVAGQVNVG